MKIPNIKPDIVFFTTRVAKINAGYWKKLRRCVLYLNQMVGDVRIIGGFNLIYLFTWVDVSYSTHPNMRSHTGGLLSMGYGILH